MAIRLNGLKARIALTTTLVVAAALVANAAYLFFDKRAELRRDIEQRATTFALLTRQPICEGYDTYYASGFYKFRELMKNYFTLEPDVEKILIVDVTGRILFDSAELEENAPRGSRPSPQWISARAAREGRGETDDSMDPVLDAVRGMDSTRLPTLDSTGAPALQIVTPHIEDWGRHKFSVLYRVHYRNLGPGIWRAAYTIGGVTLLLILWAALAASALASRIASSLETASPA